MNFMISSATAAAKPAPPCGNQGDRFEKLQEKLLAAGYFAALQIEEGIVTFCVTERRTKEEVDGLISIIREV